MHQDSFITCFTEVADSISYDNKEEKRNFFESLKSQKNITLPCMNLEHYPDCIEYCNWHQTVFKDMKKEELLTIMKYALPQRKIVSGSDVMTNEKGTIHK